MVINSFLGVLTRVTNAVFSTTFPVTSPIFILSPILKGRIYVITKPATIFPIMEVDPNEKTTPIKTDTPLKTAESEPGK